jgi:hypothetical protein
LAMVRSVRVGVAAGAKEMARHQVAQLRRAEAELPRHVELQLHQVRVRVRLRVRVRVRPNPNPNPNPNLHLRRARVVREGGAQCSEGRRVRAPHGVAPASHRVAASIT